jgi:hypothetical protein
VGEFRVRKEVVEGTERALRDAGADGFELFVLWTGMRDASTLSVTTAHIPDQRSFRGDEGLHVRVGPEALHALNVWLYQNKQILAVQVHTHPGPAYHSETDDTYPMVTTLGGLSLVVPDFCRDGLSFETVAGYRLTDTGWERLHVRSLRALIRVVA